MNLFKRAWWRLTATLGKTFMLTGLFFVVCTLVLSGFLIQTAADRAAAAAKEKVGAVATLSFDVNALMESGRAQDGGQTGLQIDPADQLRSGQVDKLGASPSVSRFSYEVESAALPSKDLQVYRAVPPPPATDTESGDFLKVSGVRDTTAMSAFRNGGARLIAGHGIGPDTKGNVLLVEQRLADKNKLKVGDRIKVRSFPGDISKAEDIEFTVGGVYTSDTRSSGHYVPALSEPGNQIYTTPEGAGALSAVPPTSQGSSVHEATFTLRGPDDLDRLKQDAKKLGLDAKIYPIQLNDKQYQQLTGPITKTAGFASLTVWLVSVAGLAILTLIVASSLRERRRELGILLSLGESRPRLLGQHLLEIAACALIAVGLAVPASQALAQSAGGSLLAGEVSNAKSDAQQDEGNKYADSTGSDTPEEEPDAAPIDELDVRLTARDIGKVGAAGLGIAAAATFIPGYRVLRLKPREILTRGD
ncbi:MULTISPECIES: ABC transporter permease [unclassified Streptomyces]|uniref:ABC transporter permease n=1 Tax=unclassified Streptomyces TaxID=2593676 RepID=UPI000DBA8E5E|nr:MULTISPECIES: ABC transporter permease [unclassified Streptomyces]MYT73428.1 FtsX-like permease family protein [Streptomyces sp. SID8367]RAJ84956.1 putative ABC transport system permease protein [Streptomyces sp. PsTaAH-137]